MKFKSQPRKPVNKQINNLHSIVSVNIVISALKTAIRGFERVDQGDLV